MHKKSTKNQKKIRILFIAFFWLSFFNLSCTFPVRQLPVLESDKGFILVTKDALGEISKSNTERNLKKKIEETQSSVSPDVQNDRSIFLIRVGRIEEAEGILLSIVKNDPNRITSLLNLIRLYYLLDEYDGIRKVFSDLIFSEKLKEKLVENILSELEKSKRFEERVILLDVLSNRKGWEIRALEELGAYFYGIGNLENASIYFEKILSANSFHVKALYSMAEISIELEKYPDAVMYATNLVNEKKYEGSAYLLLLKANYGLGNYREALRLAQKAPESAKSELEFLIFWKNSILANDISADLSMLKIYFSKLQSKGLKIEEKDFFTETTDRKFFLNTVRGK